MKQTVIITGASQGIGAAIALKLANEGYHTLLLARNEDKLQKMVALIQSEGGEATYYVTDVANSASVSQTFENMAKDFPSLPLILINNVGWGGPFHRADEVSEEEWNQIFDINVKSAFLFCRKLLPLMQQQHFGRIVNISSVFGLYGGTGSSTYSATKHALIGYTKSLAVEWGRFGITANSISPGYIETEMNTITEANKSYYDAVLRQVPVKKLGKPEHIADLVALLIKPETTYINGENLVIDGGLTAGFDFVG